LNQQEKLEASVGEINKGNQIIQKIQTEYRGLKVRTRRHADQSVHWSPIVCTSTDMALLALSSVQTKLRLKSDVMKQQERLLEEREHALEDATRRLQAAADSRASLEEHVERLKKDLATATTKLEESNRLIESNQQVRRTPLDAAVCEAAGAHAHDAYALLFVSAGDHVAEQGDQRGPARAWSLRHHTDHRLHTGKLPVLFCPILQTHSSFCMRSVELTPPPCSPACL
jgi:spindle assembly abnormal protein 6